MPEHSSHTVVTPHVLDALRSAVVSVDISGESHGLEGVGTGTAQRAKHD